LEYLDCYEPDTRAGETPDNPNPYPNRKLFDAIEKFRKLQKIKERGAVKPGHWTEVKINQELEKKKQIEKKDMENIDTNKVTDMKMSDKGIEWLKDKEDKVLDKYGNHVVYDDATRKPVNYNEPLPQGATIGYGHLIKLGEDFSAGLTEQQAIALLRSDIAVAERAVQDNITAQMSQTQYDALVSLAYNIGTSGFKNSTVVKYINNPNFHSSIYPNLESAWKAWSRSQGKVSNGLINRRQNEWNLYKRGIY
jgi:GH24 family phage-related lysozyme (muramidase)